MSVLLDTHVALWWLGADPRLSEIARAIIGDPNERLLWSVASSFEIAVKIAAGKLRLDRPVGELYAAVVGECAAELLPITHEHCERLATLPLHHRDPFDRLLVAQALVERAPLLSADPKLSAYGVDRRW